MSIISDCVPPLVGLGATGAASYYRGELAAVGHSIRGSIRYAKYHLLYWHEYFWPSRDVIVSEQIREHQSHPGYLWGGDNSQAMMDWRANHKEMRKSQPYQVIHKPRGQPWDEFYSSDLAAYPRKPQAVIDWERQNRREARFWIESQ